MASTIKSGSNNDLYIQTDGVDRIVVDSNGNTSVTGNVGINTTNQLSYYAKDLVVNAANEGGITIVGGTSDAQYIMFADGTAGADRYRGYIEYSHAQNHMNFTTNGDYRVSINANGYVTMPYQPAFSAVRETSAPSGSDVILNGIWANVGGHYNTANGRFTCPVAGTYMFSCSGLANPTGSTSRWSIKLNGTSNKSSESRQQGGTVGAYLYGTSQTIITLSANDYVTMYYYNDDGSTQLYSDSTPYITFSGHLIG